MADNFVEIYVSVPDGLTGEVLGHLNRLGGTVTNIHQETAAQSMAAGRPSQSHFAR